MAVTERLFARRHVLIIHAFCFFVVASYSVMAVLETGPVRPAAQGVVLAGLLLWAAAIRVTLAPRSRGPVEPRADGTLVVEAPTALMAFLVGAWLAILVAVVAWVFVAVTDFGAIESPGGMFVMVVGGIGTLPDLARLVTGRLFRWRVVADDDGIRYRGYHTDRSLAWSEIAAITSPQRPPGVTITAKQGEPAIVVPAIAFGVHPDAIAEALSKRRARSGRH